MSKSERFSNRTAALRTQAVAILAILFVPGGTGDLGAQESPASRLAAQSVADSNAAYPSLQRRRETVLIGGGAGLLATGILIPANGGIVPARGYGVTEISWSADRRTVGNTYVAAVGRSDWMRNASMAFPLALALTRPRAGTSRELARRSFVGVETQLISQGLTIVLKNAIGRARPFAYIEEGSRPADAAFDVSLDRTYRSMPSGHASSAWTATTLGIVEHLLIRPQAGRWERVGVGALGGFLASSTATLRVTAGQHFPSDVIAGAVLGSATGLTIPLLHRGAAPMPTAEAWLESGAGVIVGTVVGVLVWR